MWFALNFLLGKYCYRSLQVIDLCKGALRWSIKQIWQKEKKTMLKTMILHRDLLWPFVNLSLFRWTISRKGLRKSEEKICSVPWSYTCRNLRLTYIALKPKNLVWSHYISFSNLSEIHWKILSNVNFSSFQKRRPDKIVQSQRISLRLIISGATWQP